MNNRHFSCVATAGFLGIFQIALTPNPAFSNPRPGDVVVTGARLKPVTMRHVSYDDLNLAQRTDQKQLRGRIHYAADDLCGPALGYEIRDHQQRLCVERAETGTHLQVYRAIKRAKLQLAGQAVGPAVAILIAAHAH
jgi:UrcA family protein